MPRELWAKIAVEVIRDPKLISRPAWERWFWIGLICLAKEVAEDDGVLRGFDAAAVGGMLNLGVTAAKVRAAIEYFASAGMVELRPDGAITLINFAKRQAHSDSPEAQAERSRRYYEKNRETILAQRKVSRQSHGGPTQENSGMSHGGLTASHSENHRTSHADVDLDLDKDQEKEKEKKEQVLSSFSLDPEIARARQSDATPTEKAKIKNALGIDRKQKHGAVDVQDLARRIGGVVQAGLVKRGVAQNGGEEVTRHTPNVADTQRMLDEKDRPWREDKARTDQESRVWLHERWPDKYPSAEDPKWTQ